MVSRRRVLGLALCLVGCGSSSEEAAPRPDLRADLQGFRLREDALGALDHDIYLQADDGLKVLSSKDQGLRPVLDDSYRACPWTNAWKSGPSVRDDVTITYGTGSAYLYQPLCGLWSVSLQDPSKVTPIVRVLESRVSPTDTNAAWGDGTPAKVSPTFDIAAVPDGDGLLVCLMSGGDGGDGVELWSVSADGKPREMVGKNGGVDCKGLVRDDAGAFVSIYVGGVYRWDRSTRAMTRITTPSSAGAKSLQTTATHLYYLDGDQIMRVGKDGAGLTRIERDPADSDIVTRFIVDDRNLYVATQTKIVRIPQNGDAAGTMLATTSTSRIATEKGFVTAGDGLWFVWTEGATAEEQKRYLARLPK